MTPRPTQARGDIAIAILAAGSSSRLGEPKQLLRIRGRTLLEHAARTALSAKCGPVVVVLGAHARTLRPLLADLPVRITINRKWSGGLGTSIAAAVRTAERLRPPVAAILLMLCDQVHLTATIVTKLVRAWRKREGEKDIVACAYANTFGPPAIFPRRLFEDLLNLRPAQGAKPILRSHGAEFTAIPFRRGEEDIDTPADRARAYL